eukprot:gene4108-5083_t
MATLVFDTSSSDSDDLDADEATQEQVCADDKTEQRSSGAAKQAKQTAAQATPPNEEDAEEAPQWIWDELAELKKAHVDVVVTLSGAAATKVRDKTGTVEPGVFL